MAYITAEEVKVIRNNIKKAFPAKAGWKFSVTCEHHSAVRVAIMKAPKEYGFEGFHSVNHYYINEHYENNAAEMLEKLSDIVHANHWDESDPMTDYFHCAYYVTINVGKWNKPCVAA